MRASGAGPDLRASAAHLLTCEGCATRYDVSKRTPGKQVRCPRCRTVMTVPAARGAEAPRDSRLTASSRLRRAKGASCRDHPRELAIARCRACGADVCSRCRADAPVDHFCRACAAERQLAGALPVDFGLLRTPLLALSAMLRTLPRMLAWNLLALLLTVLVFAPPVVLFLLGWDRSAPAASVDLWRAIKADLFAGVVIASLLAWLVSYYLLLVPAGCAVLLDDTLRGRELPLGAAFRAAWRRVARTGPSLVGVGLLLIVAGFAALMPGLAMAYALSESASQEAAGLFLLGYGLLASLAVCSAITVAVPVVVLEERPALEALGRAWTLARARVWDVATLVMGYGLLHAALSGALYLVRDLLVGPGDLLVPGLLVVLGHVVDLLWPALLVATYHGLAAEEAEVVGRS